MSGVHEPCTSRVLAGLESLGEELPHLRVTSIRDVSMPSMPRKLLLRLHSLTRIHLAIAQNIHLGTPWISSIVKTARTYARIDFACKQV